ncbi:amidase [Segetibacter sp.]|uniref:amidase n=1 Tax=Segetibacter sp. TaxID=2231182 RepID=UPI002631F01B|nr:amidase [Segetibacter sp.]MCW3079224.1 amidase [Segetibacter sp.]
MNRRHFLKNGSLAGFTLPAIVTGTAHAASDDSEGALTRFALKDSDLVEVTIDELQQKMRSGTLTSKAITKGYLKRIEDVDKKGPAINSVIEVNPDAITIAEAMDAERKAGKVRGPLHGIPVLIKDNIDTADKMMTTAGSLALVGNKASKDAFIVKQLREAGAVILGKTNLSEFANFRSSRSTSAWSSRGGQTKCPYILNRNPSGSSAGSGSASAASLCAVAIGTETNGSIVSPASTNGLVGFKPTVGLWSRSGIIPISATQDTAGPMTRTVRDAAILLSALTGLDPADAVTQQSQGKFQKDYTKFLDPDGLKGKRIGVEASFLKGNAKVVGLFNQAITVLKEKGATIVEVELLKLTRPLGEASYEVLQYEFKDGLNSYLATANAPVKSLKEVIGYNNKNEAIAMPFFKQETLISSDAKSGLDSKEYKDALTKSTSSRKIIDELFQQNKLDAICGITSGPAGCIDIINGDYSTGFSFSSPAAMAGYPHITVPMGFVHELPVGFSIFGTAYSEGPVLSIAYAFEQATKARKAPKYLANIG